MYLTGWVACPHCCFRWQICLEVDGPSTPGQATELRCPNDGSRHRFPLVNLRPVADCPPGIQPVRVDDSNAHGRPTGMSQTARWWQFWK